jgi:cytochrome c-type biogenesis protein CcmH
MKKIVLLYIIVFFSSGLWAAPAQDIYHFNTVTQQNQFNALIQNLRCLVCQNQYLAESNASLAKDLRTQIFSMVETGKSDQEIKQYLVQRYGEFVSYTPPFEPGTYILWGLPVILLLGGIAIILWRILA